MYKPGGPNLWVPALDRSGLQIQEALTGCWSDLTLALDWLVYLQTTVLPKLDLSLEGQIWYQGEWMVCGSFRATINGRKVSSLEQDDA